MKKLFWPILAIWIIGVVCIMFMYHVCEQFQGEQELYHELLKDDNMAGVWEVAKRIEWKGREDEIVDVNDRIVLNKDHTCEIHSESFPYLLHAWYKSLSPNRNDIQSPICGTWEVRLTEESGQVNSIVFRMNVLGVNYENEELLRFDVKQKKVRIDLGQVDLYGLGKYGKYKTIRFYKVSDDER